MELPPPLLGLWVLNDCLLRACTLDIFGHLELLSRSWLFLGLDRRVVDLGLSLLPVHPVEHVANVVASTELLPEIAIDVIVLLAEVVLIVNLLLVDLLLIKGFHLKI